MVKNLKEVCSLMAILIKMCKKFAFCGILCYNIYVNSIQEVIFMKETSNIIKVSLTEDDVFVLVDPDTGKTIRIMSKALINKRYFVDAAIEHHFLEQFPGKTECDCSPEAAACIKSIADWNEDYED